MQDGCSRADALLASVHATVQAMYSLDVHEEPQARAELKALAAMLGLQSSKPDSLTVSGLQRYVRGW